MPQNIKVNYKKTQLHYYYKQTIYKSSFKLIHGYMDIKLVVNTRFSIGFLGLQFNVSWWRGFGLTFRGECHHLSSGGPPQPLKTKVLL